MSSYSVGMAQISHRDQLLDGAIECLRTKGYARTTARDIAAASGSNLGSIGYHFGSKEALMNEAIREGCTQWTEQLERIAFSHEGATPIERLAAAWQGVAETFEEQRTLLVAFLRRCADSDVGAGGVAPHAVARLQHREGEPQHRPERPEVAGSRQGPDDDEQQADPEERADRDAADSVDVAAVRARAGHHRQI